MPFFGRHTTRTTAIPVVTKRVITNDNARTIGDDTLTPIERELMNVVLDGFSFIRPEAVEALVNNQYDKSYDKEVDRAFSMIESDVAHELHRQLVQSGKAEANQLSQQIVTALEQTVGKAETSPIEIAASFAFNANHPEALSWARNESSRLVTNMKKEQIAMIRRVMGQSFGAGATRVGTSSNLRTILEQISPGTDAGKLVARTLGVNSNGLTVRYEQALYNHSNQLARQLAARGVEGTKALEKIKTSTDKYATKLRRARARTIARTESMMAYNEGKQQAWNQAADKGLINKRTARKVWHTGPFDVCTICAPLNGQTQPLDKPFSIKRMTPPAHPNCRCTMALNSMPSGQRSRGMGTGKPNDPFRVSVPDHPDIDDFAPLPGTDIPDVTGAPRPTIPAEGFTSERRVVGGEDIEFHIHSDGRVRVPGTEIERDPTGRWFRPDKNATPEEFIPSRNSAAGKIERAVKGGSPPPIKPVVVEPPVVVPEPLPVIPEPIPQPSVPTIQEFDADGKVPAFRINTDGSIRLEDTYHNGSLVRRTLDGKWQRIDKPNGYNYVEFTPSQNSAAGQLERHLKRNNFKPGEVFKPAGVVTPPKPVTPDVKPIPAPENQYVPPIGDTAGFEISREGIIVIEGETYSGSPIMRLADGRWIRSNRTTGQFEEFVPMRLSAAGRIEENLRSNNFKVGDMFVRPDLKPTTLVPTGTGTAGPLSGARPDLVVDIEDLRDDISLLEKGVPTSRKTSDWIGWDEHPNLKAAMDAIDEAGGRVLAKIEQELLRLDPTALDDIKAVEALIVEANDRAIELAQEVVSEYRKAWYSVLDDIHDRAVSPRTKALMSYVEIPASDNVYDVYLSFDLVSRNRLLEAMIEEGDTEAGRLLARLLRAEDPKYLKNEWVDIVERARANAKDAKLTPMMLEQDFVDFPQFKESIESWQAANRAKTKHGASTIELRKEVKKIKDRVDTRRREVMLDVLRASRPYYGQPRASIGSYFSNVTLPRTINRKLWDNAIEELDGMLPAEWVGDTIAQTRRGGWTAKFSKRGRNTQQLRLIEISGHTVDEGRGKNGWRSTLMHEFQHSTQDVRGVAQSEYAIINRLGKKQGLSSSSTPQVYLKVKGKPPEIAFDLGIGDLYTGRIYSFGSTEVTTRGLERLFYEDWDTMRVNGDEYIRYLLGMLMGV